MKRILLAATLAALVSGAIPAQATPVTAINPQSCQIPEACVDMNAQLVPNTNTAIVSSFAPAVLGTNTIATLGTTCTAAQKGQMWYVTDAAATPVYNATVAGSGTVIIPVFCNGTNWTNH